MAKLRKVTYGESGHTQYLYMCPGCGYEHAIGVKPDGVHNWNGSYDKPTFTPSLLQNWNPERVCHSYITDGHIKFLPDCWHHLKDQTVELAEYTQIEEL